MLTTRTIALITAIGLIYLGYGDCELFTAQVELEPLFQTQESIVEAVESYLAHEEVRLKEIRRRLLPYTERGRRSHDEVLHNPISAFLLVKGLTLDLEDLVTIIEKRSNAVDFGTAITELKQKNKFPNHEDLTGAATAITRLQETYLLDTKEMAQGLVNGQCCSLSLTAEDLFELGRQNYNQGEHDQTIAWMNEALLRYQEENQNGSYALGKAYRAVTQVDMMEYLAFSTYQKGEISSALSLTEQLLQMDPEHPRAAGNIVHYKQMVQNRRGEDGSETEQTFTVKERRAAQVGWEKTKYEALCRGEMQTHQPAAKCRYMHGGHPYLLLGPVKEEVAHIKPNIYIYHDVIFDGEIKLIQELAKPRFKRATVHDHATGELVTANYRISKSSWLQGGDHPMVDKVNRRINAVTKLELKTAEELQVVNYGLAGHYEPHFDFARRDEKDAFQGLGTGNRIATFLFYMSDVAAGGATVFPQLNLSLWPKKGAAAFWYNLFEDGVGDTSTRHAACPVLLGGKWVANKWIHERGQEFIRPCKLSKSVPYEEA